VAKKRTKPSVAFALGGLGGFNAHGAGFLAAASEFNLVPDLVTATSGQITVLADWFQGADLEKSIVDPDLEHNPVAQAAILLWGYPGIFRPAYFEALRRWWMPLTYTESPLTALFDRLLPAQVYVPTRRPQDFETIARVLNSEAMINGHEVGVICNAYNLETGETILFGNNQARELWKRKRSIPNATRSIDDRGSSAGHREPQLQPITAEAVASALWLSLYGFDQLPHFGLMDGAYARSCIVAELHNFDQIFVARPLARGWHTRPPSNWFEVQDWQTEMWFSASYKAEVDTLHKINGLVADKLLPSRFRQVELVEIAPEVPAGFFNYFVERHRIYTSAYNEAVSKFIGLGMAPSALRSK
jgi:hypothetical protein